MLGYSPKTPFSRGIEKFVSWYLTEKKAHVGE
jgi:nucleoside-diphosphate-sugar epimerase